MAQAGGLVSTTDNLRFQLTRAIDDSVAMHLLQQQPGQAGLCLYIGLWGMWQLNTTMRGLKVILATSQWSAFGPHGAPPHTILGEIPWFIMQMQCVDADHPLWERIQQVLAEDIAASAESEDAKRKCRVAVPFNSTQATQSIRPFKNQDYLADVRIQRIDKPRTDHVPFKTMDRDTTLYGLSSEADAGLALQIIVERTTPKMPVMGSMLNQERGLVKDSSLLAAIGEWRTWIVIGD